MNWASLLIVSYCIILCSGLTYKTETFDLPAYATQGNGGISSRGEQIPLPYFERRIGIQYWGGWEVINAETNQPMSRGQVFFHHITVFRAHDNGDREFLTGCSDDRRTLGPDLDVGYLQLVDSSPKDPNIQGYYHLVNLMPHTVKMAVRYNVTYVADDDIPEHTTFLVAHFMSTAYNVPGNGGHKSIHSQVTSVSAPATGRVITAVGHLHQGAMNVTLFDGATKQPLVTSHAIYAKDNEDDKCFYAEWCAQSGNPWTRNRVKDLQLVKELDFMISVNAPWEMISYYDNGAEYRTVMAWIVLFVDQSATA